MADTLPTNWSHVNHRSGNVRQPKTDVITTEPTVCHVTKHKSLHALQEVGKGTVEKMRLETTVRKLVERTAQTWRGSSFQTRAAAATGRARSPTVDSSIASSVAAF